MQEGPSQLALLASLVAIARALQAAELRDRDEDAAKRSGRDRVGVAPARPSREVPATRLALAGNA